MPNTVARRRSQSQVSRCYLRNREVQFSRRDCRMRPVCGEFQFMRQLGSEIRRCSVAASDMTEGLLLEEEVWNAPGNFVPVDTNSAIRHRSSESLPSMHFF